MKRVEAFDLAALERYPTTDIESYQMPKLTQFAAPFSAGLCVALLVVFTLGASKATKPDANMSIEVVPVLGGVGGILMTVTDHAENKAYMYIVKSEKKKEEDADADDTMPLPELVGTIDLSSAGDEKLSAEIRKQ